MINFCQIIIPTFNNSPALAKTLGALFSQSVPAAWRLELLLSDDGSPAAAVAASRRLLSACPWPAQVITGPRGGAAAARNRALVQAIRPAQTSALNLILFLGADIILRPGALAAHLNFHDRHPALTAAALGVVKWDPAVSPTPLMEWLTHGGNQNNFDALLGSATADPARFFYGSNLSIKSARLAAHQFPEAYRSYGWEDLDLGRTLAPGLKLYFLPTAIGLHHHRQSAPAIIRRQREIGRNLVIYQQRYLNQPLIPPRRRFHRLKYSLARAAGLILLLRFLTLFFASRSSIPGLFSRTLSAELWQGIYSSHNYPHQVNSYPHTFPQ